MDVAKEIIRLEQDSDWNEREGSARKWHATHLIWKELEKGKTQTQLSDELKAACEEAGHKHAGPFCGVSQPNISLRKRCWQAAVADVGLEGWTYETLPLFRDVYMSFMQTDDKQKSDSKKSSKDGDGDGERLSGLKEPRGDEDKVDHSPHGRVLELESAVTQIADFPAGWRHLSEEDLNMIVGLIGRLRKVVDGANQGK
jgi:hypothetical protein